MGIYDDGLMYQSLNDLSFKINFNHDYATMLLAGIAINSPGSCESIYKVIGILQAIIS